MLKTQHTHDYILDENKLLKKETDSFLCDFSKVEQTTSDKYTLGIELEAWIVDNKYRAAPVNKELIDLANKDGVVEELLKFNIEFNSPVFTIKDNLLTKIRDCLEDTWQSLRETADLADCKIVRIGSLPSLKQTDIKEVNVSSNPRYKAMNEIIMAHNRGNSFKFQIKGTEELDIECKDIFTEGATTSLQIHTKLSNDIMPNFYNASLLASGPLVAIGSNSPYLFQKELWEETRIAIFEKSVVHEENSPIGPWVNRVGLGKGYCKESLAELFVENVELFPSLIAFDFDSNDSYANVKKHNGTIWRWVRPVIGEDKDGSPHIRVEQRVCASAPSTKDDVANIAFYLGLSYSLATKKDALDVKPSFKKLEKDFYDACKYGINAEVTWIDGNSYKLSELILVKLIPMASEGLKQLGLCHDDVSYYLEDVLKSRVESGQTGSQWQKSYMQKENASFEAMLEEYAGNQELDLPISKWK